MPTATENRQPASLSPLTRLLVRHPVAAFLVMIYAIAWGVFLPVVLQARGLLALPVDLTEGFAFDAVTSLASILGVALPAFLVTAATSGKAGVRGLLGRCLRWRVGIVWYLAALFGLLASMVLLGSSFSDPAPLEVLTERWRLLFTLFLPEVLFPFLFIQFFEEVGWTGFMQHTLQERRRPLVASALVAPAFVLQHLPILLMDAGIGLSSLIVVGALVVVAVFFRVVVTWLYNRSGHSVLVVALFHSAYNSAWGTGDHRFTGELIPGPAATLIPIGVVALAAVAVAVLSRGRLAYEPGRGAANERGGRSGSGEDATTNLSIAARVPAQGDPIPPAEKGDSLSHSLDGARGHKARGAEGETSKKGIAHVRPAEGRRSLRVFGELVTCKVNSDRTGGAYSLFEVTTQPGEGPPPHVHHREDESFYVLEGEYGFFSGEGIIRVRAGSLLCVPRGVLHSHKNVGEAVGRLLVTQTPGGLYERFFEEVGEEVDSHDGGPPAFEDRPDARTIMEAAAAHGIEIPPPIATQ